MNILRQRTLSLIIFIFIIGVDQASKSAAHSLLRFPGDTLALSGPLDITLVMNRSNAFGMVPYVEGFTPWLLVAANVIVTLLLIRLIWREQRALMSAGFAVIAAGALGNAIDRFRFGAVVDFLDASKLAFPWVFNVADASIDLGIGLILLSKVHKALVSRQAAPENVA